MASQHPASESPSGKWTTNVRRLDCPSADDLMCLDTSSNTFTLDFCNIHGLRSNFQSVEHHPSSTKPHLLFLTETQLSVTTESGLAAQDFLLLILILSIFLMQKLTSIFTLSSLTLVNLPMILTQKKCQDTSNVN